MTMKAQQRANMEEVIYGKTYVRRRIPGQQHAAHMPAMMPSAALSLGRNLAYIHMNAEPLDCCPANPPSLVRICLTSCESAPLSRTQTHFPAVFVVQPPELAAFISFAVGRLRAHAAIHVSAAWREFWPSCCHPLREGQFTFIFLFESPRPCGDRGSGLMR